MYVTHRGWLQHWLAGKLGNRDAAADLVHDTFVRIMSGRRLPQPDGEQRAFLTKVAKGLLIDRWRHEDIERAYLDTVALLPEDQSPSPETRLLVLETLHRIDAMLRGLPPKVCEAFVLSQLDGLPYAEIAARLELSLITVKRHIKRALLACLTAL
ncbi:sigma-70 family RNA polymerase sigma factor [Herbaspirillum sp. LeCh32-8]|nr:sigma-70 family RNA polymerase sigma factor [Herbaspirillum sp. LeCh32-8]MBP0599280.1 sigma-70 family RNA polymerase sigma factor [Herbaspirillum sp. LeCh32-8]